MSSDRFDDQVPPEPGLEQLLATLTGAPTADELAGEHEARTMFAAASKNGARPRRHAGHPSRWLAAASAFTVIAGFATAGYAAALPAPLQQVAHRILGFAGVPNSGPPSGSAGSSPTALTPPGRTGSGAQSPHPSSPHPSSARPSSPSTTALLTATVSRSRITAGGGVVVTALLTAGGRAVPGSSLRLMELAAGESAWTLAANAITGSGGRAVLDVSDLRTNALFQVTGQPNLGSQRLSVIVIPPVSFAGGTLGGRHRSEILTVSCPLAQRGDVVELQALSAGAWQRVRHRRLDGTGKLTMVVRAGKVSVSYRVVLLATAAHGQSTSNTVVVAARSHGRSR